MSYRLFAIAATLGLGAFVSISERPATNAQPQAVTAASRGGETVIYKNSEYPRLGPRGLVSAPVRPDYRKGQWI